MGGSANFMGAADPVDPVDRPRRSNGWLRSAPMIFVGIERRILIFGRHDFATTLIFRLNKVGWYFCFA